MQYLLAFIIAAAVTTVYAGGGCSNPIPQFIGEASDARIETLRLAKEHNLVVLDNSKCCVDSGDPLTSDTCKKTERVSWCNLRPTGIRGIYKCSGISDDCP